MMEEDSSLLCGEGYAQGRQEKSFEVNAYQAENLLEGGEEGCPPAA